MTPKWVPPMLVSLCCIASLATVQPALSAGNARVQKLDDDDQTTTDDAQSSATDPADPPAVQLMCTQVTTLIGQKQLDSAQRVLVQATQAAPKSVPVKRLYAYLYLSRNQPLSAVQVMEQVQKTTKLTGPDQVLLGTAYWRTGAMGQAEGAFQAAIALNENDFLAQTDYIRCMTNNKKFALAVAECNKALAHFKTPNAQSTLKRLKQDATAGLLQGPIEPKYEPAGAPLEKKSGG